ncbi:MAG: hypothetical protein JNL28_00470 [Planctomycetes bacterium]|nr:hypothetical protein [Planctomycetota bacterium]
MSSNRTPAPDDWRRHGQERYLIGVRLVARTYAVYSPHWDHDHCEFCSEPFSLHEGDLSEGYATEDAYRWVCAPCFEDFRGELKWTVVSS